MLLSELIEILEGVEHTDGDVEVRLAVQPSWPFEHALSRSTAVVDGVLYLAEAGQVGYLSGEVSEELGWR